MLNTKTLLMNKDNVRKIDRALKENKMTPKVLARITGFETGISMAIISFKEGNEAWAKAVLLQGTKILGQTNKSKKIDEPWIISFEHDVFLTCVKSNPFVKEDTYISY